MTRPIGMSTSLLWPASLPEAIEAIGRAGFPFAEIAPGHLTRDLDGPEQARSLRCAMSQVGVRAWSVHAPFGGENDLGAEAPGSTGAAARLSRTCDLAAAAGAAVLVVHPTDQQRPAAGPGALLERVRASLAAVQPACQRTGVTLAIELMLPHLVGGRADELVWLCERLPSERVGVCLDIAHASFGPSIAEAAQVLADRVRLVHVSDNDGRRDAHLFPGEGRIDWNGVRAILDRAQYGGPVVVEAAPRAVSHDDLVAVRARARALLGGE